ncbi:MAG: hypothetical protein ACE5GY_09100 [Thermodesulfobacteriota bacterium]
MRFYVLLAMVAVVAVPSVAYSGNGSNFVLYNHHTPEAGEKEVMFMNDLAQEPDGTRYAAQMIEFELGITDRLATEFMIEGQFTSGQGGYHFTGFRWETRYRLFEYGTFLNPVLYMEYESLGEDTKYLMEVSGREDASAKAKSRPRERVFETRVILGEDLTDRLDVAFNWLNESDLDTGVTSFGYAVGLNYKLSGETDGEGHLEAEHGFHPGVRLGLELFGGLGDSDKGLTADSDVTQHYLGLNAMLHLSGKSMAKFGYAVGLTNVSQDLFRFALGYEF